MKARIAIAAAALGAVACAEPVCWFDDFWDADGAPRGALLSDNPGWWGRSVFTGVTYSYEKEPTNPRDILKGDKESFGRRLIDGNVNGDWNTPVGKTGKEPLVAVFDFKRPCAFTEIDLFSSRTPAAHGIIETSPDGETWMVACSFNANKTRMRIGLVAGNAGRYLRLSFKADKGITYLDEVLVWGEGAVSERYPEMIAEIPSGNALKFTERRDGGIEIWPMVTPTLEAKPGGPHSSATKILMSRNETEVRYFAVVNAGANPQVFALVPPSFGSGVAAELRIGGVVRTTPPKMKLTEKQIIDLLITDVSKLEEDREQVLDVQPFFAVDAKPAENFARKYLANPRQVAGFPFAVPLAPGEGCVVMLRVTSDGAKPGVRSGVLRAGAARMEVALDVRDMRLPELPLWIHAYSPFTRQFPFESDTRMENDAKRLAGLGVSSCYGMPKPRSKQARLKAMAPHTICAMPGWVSGRVTGGAYNGAWAHFDETNRAAIAEGAHGVVREARELGLKPEEYCIFLPDEPGRHNAALFGEMARIVKSAEPTLQIYMNPCFWERGFPPEKAILDCLKPYYNEVIDISCPIRNLVREGSALTRELWTAKRRVNAQYIHPATRAGRSIAWSAFRNGLNGFGYYCYYAPRGNPWDIRTWKGLDYRYQMVFPLENDVAVTAIYELMREAWEDYRLLEAVRRAGKKVLLAELLGAYEKAQDYTDIENVPNHADFLALHYRALQAF